MTRRLFLCLLGAAERENFNAYSPHHHPASDFFLWCKNLRDRTRIWIKCPCFERALALPALLCFASCAFCYRLYRAIIAVVWLAIEAAVRWENYLSLSRYVLVSFIIGAHIHYVNRHMVNKGCNYKSRVKPHRLEKVSQVVVVVIGLMTT